MEMLQVSSVPAGVTTLHEARFVARRECRQGHSSRTYAPLCLIIGCMEIQTTDDASLYAPRKLNHHEARVEQLLYWSRKSVPERLAAMTALTRRMVEMRGIPYDEQQADLTPSRVRRRRS